MAERINLWQHFPGSLSGSDLMGMVFDHADLLEVLRERILSGEYLFESTSPSEGEELFDVFCAQYLYDYNETGEFSSRDLALLSDHIWNGCLHFDSDGNPPEFLG